MIIKEMWFFLARGKSGKFASGQEKAQVLWRSVKSQPQSLFSGEKFSENTVKIIKKVKNQEKSNTDFFGGKFFYKVSAAELNNKLYLT